MNKEWSDINKRMQVAINKSSTYPLGIELLLKLRSDLFETIRSFFGSLRKEDFSAIPYLNAVGYHNKTVAYSVWHIFRIEDIVVNSLINDDVQIFFARDYRRRINADIITTGNELVGRQIADFSTRLDLNELLLYASEVKDNTDAWLKVLKYQDLKVKVPFQKREYLQSLKVVSDDQSAFWLIDYWCKKDNRELIKMPLSRHWIMHIEASLRIIRKIRKNLDEDWIHLPAIGSSYAENQNYS